MRKKQKRSLEAICILCVFATAGCIKDNLFVVSHEGYDRGVRNESRHLNPLEREGLAFSRILASPAMIPLSMAGEFQATDHLDYLNRTVRAVFDGVIEAPILMCQEICVGVVEAVGCCQFKSLYYPWEEYSQRIGWEQTEMTQKVKAEYRAKNPGDPNVNFAKDLLQGAVEGSVEVLSQAAVNAASQQSNKNANAVNDGVSGAGRITGPANLGYGETGVYYLYVGGRKVNADWAQDGTSISIYGSGDHARAMGGNPPIRSGRYRSGVRATYNGKTYKKTVYIVK